MGVVLVINVSGRKACFVRAEVSMIDHINRIIRSLSPREVPLVSPSEAIFHGQVSVVVSIGITYG